MTSLRFQIDPLPRETFRGCQAIVAASLPPNRSVLIVIAVYALIGAAAAMVTPSTAPATIIIAIGGLLVLVYGSQAYSRRRTSTLIDADPHALETHFIELDTDGIHCWCKHMDSRFSWADVTKVKESRDFYLFLRPGGNGVAIPRRVLDADLESQLQSRIKEWSPDKGAHLANTASRTKTAV
jgi:hypothetical protein